MEIDKCPVTIRNTQRPASPTAERHNKGPTKGQGRAKQGPTKGQPRAKQGPRKGQARANQGPSKGQPRAKQGPAKGQPRANQGPARLTHKRLTKRIKNNATAQKAGEQLQASAELAACRADRTGYRAVTLTACCTDKATPCIYDAAITALYLRIRNHTLYLRYRNHHSV
jgi:hypothetical protein